LNSPFSDETEKKLKYYDVKYDIEETYNDGIGIDSKKNLSDLLSSLETIKPDGKRYRFEYWNYELFNLKVGTHIFTHEFYTAYFSVKFYLNR
jgi:hypothetical protein